MNIQSQLVDIGVDIAIMQMSPVSWIPMTYMDNLQALMSGFAGNKTIRDLGNI